MKVKTTIIRTPRLLVGAMLVAGVVAGNLVATPFASAASGEAVWDGDAGDFKFSTASNWEGDTLPVAGDVLKFTKNANDPERTFTVDVDTTLGGLVLTGQSDKYDNFIGDSMKFAANANISSDYFSTLDTSIVGLGDLSISKFALPNTSGHTATVEGVLTLRSTVLGDSIFGYKANAYKLYDTVSTHRWGGYTTNEFTKPITLGVGGSLDLPLEHRELILSSVTLESDAQIKIANDSTVKVKNLISNGHKLTRTSDSLGSLVTPDSTQETVFETKTTKIDGDKSTEDYQVAKNETAVLAGSRRDITVYNGGILKGAGSISGRLTVQDGGIVSPGNSPGTITVLDYMWLEGGATFQAEVKNSREYDKIIVGQDDDYGLVSIGNSILELSLLDGADIKKGDTFTIIDFLRSDRAISGIFKDLPEGAHITVGAAVFSISYVGGDGNDVVLTAINDTTAPTNAPAPGTPNTGAMELVRSNPAVVAIAGIVAAVALLVIKRRQTQR